MKALNRFVLIATTTLISLAFMGMATAHANTFPMGDMNCDENLNVLDVVALVEQILSGTMGRVMRGLGVGALIG